MNRSNGNNARAKAVKRTHRNQRVLNDGQTKKNYNMQTLTRKQFTDFYHETLIELGMGPTDEGYSRWAENNGTNEAWENIREGFGAHKPGTVGHYLAGNELSPDAYDNVNDAKEIERRYRTPNGDELVTFGMGEGLIIVMPSGHSSFKSTLIDDFLANPGEREDGWEIYYEEPPDVLYLKDDDDWKAWVSEDVQNYYDQENYYTWTEDYCDHDTNVKVTAGDKTEYAKAPPTHGHREAAMAYLEQWSPPNQPQRLEFTTTTVSYTSESDGAENKWLWSNGQLALVSD